MYFGGDKDKERIMQRLRALRNRLPQEDIENIGRKQRQRLLCG
jgi:hypothetical protein